MKLQSARMHASPPNINLQLRPSRPQPPAPSQSRTTAAPKHTGVTEALFGGGGLGALSPLCRRGAGD
eukprot:813022-Alexandrium_andersonii.AAC.1